MALLSGILWRKLPWRHFNGKYRKVCICIDFVVYIFSFETGDSIAPLSNKAPVTSKLYIRRRFQFSSALKRMSTVSTLPNGRSLVAVKGAPETIKTMLAKVPEWYDATYKWYSRRGSRVLALGAKEIVPMSIDKVPSCPFQTLSLLILGAFLDQQVGTGGCRKWVGIRWLFGFPLSPQGGCCRYSQDAG